MNATSGTSGGSTARTGLGPTSTDSCSRRAMRVVMGAMIQHGGGRRQRTTRRQQRARRRLSREHGVARHSQPAEEERIDVSLCFQIITTTVHCIVSIHIHSSPCIIFIIPLGIAFSVCITSSNYMPWLISNEGPDPALFCVMLLFKCA